MPSDTYEKVLQFAERICGTTREERPMEILGFVASRLGGIIDAVEVSDGKIDERIESLIKPILE